MFNLDQFRARRQGIQTNQIPRLSVYDGQKAKNAGNLIMCFVYVILNNTKARQKAFYSLTNRKDCLRLPFLPMVYDCCKEKLL